MSYYYSREDLITDCRELVRNGTSPGYGKIKDNYERCMTFDYDGVPKSFKYHFQFIRNQLIKKYESFSAFMPNVFENYNDLMISSEAVEDTMDFIDRARGFLGVKGKGEEFQSMK